jgi:hypothetical protein
MPTTTPQAAPLRDALLLELLSAPSDGLTGSALAQRCRRAKVPCSTASAYAALNDLCELGWVHQPEYAGDIAKDINALIDALSQPDPLSTAVAIEYIGYRLTQDGITAARAAQLRRSLKAQAIAVASRRVNKIQPNVARKTR